MEFTFGITENPPSSWKKVEPIWEDEQVTATTSNTFLELMTKLCDVDSAIHKRREYQNDHGINEHLWKMTIKPPSLLLNPQKAALRRLERLLMIRRDDDDDDDDDDSGSEDDPDNQNEESNHRIILITCPQDEEFGHDHSAIGGGEEDEIISSRKKLSTAYLPKNSVVEVTYDYGTTTTLYLKLIRTRPVVVESILKYFTCDVPVEQQRKEMQSVPAYNLPKEQQIDAHFPYLSKIILGHFVPLFEEKENSDEIPHEKSHITGCVTMGKSGCTFSERHTPFCSIEGRTMSDMMVCPSVMDPQDLLNVAEEAWTPRDPDNDPDKLERYRYECILRHLIGAGPDHDEMYRALKEMIENDEGFGPKHLLFRASNDENTKQSSFNFQKVFPITYAMFTNNYFRWFQYKKDVLRVIVGRAVGPFPERDFQSEQILKTWKCKFESFHELLCAVETSWVWKGEKMSADTFLPEFDTNLEPSRPGPKEAPVLGNEDNCVTVTKNNDLKKLVTALAITEESGKGVLYSGHDDGTLAKWNLDDSTAIWSKQIYKQESDGPNRKDLGSFGGDLWRIHETMGVAGIVVRPDDRKKSKHLIYTWTHSYEGFPDVDWEDRGASKVKCWDSFGKYVRSYSCDVGDNNEGDEANPSIGAVVFCELYDDDQEAWVESMIVGLHCVPQTVDWKCDYSEFDLELVQENCSEGNILPFLEHSNNGITTPMETWRESFSLIKALAVIPRKYVFSLSIEMGCGHAEAMVLWSCVEPGVPLCRRDLINRRYRDIYNKFNTRLDEVSGISVWGADIIMADRYGDRIAVVSVETNNGHPCIEISGYGNIGNRRGEEGYFHGRMASCGPYAIMANEAYSTAWMFKSQDCGNHEKLDTREGNRYDFCDGDEECEDEDDPRQYAGREIAIGKVSFPLWGGNPPARNKRKRDDIFLVQDLYSHSKDGFGDGGPIALALRGKWLVAGFSNGTIARAPHLPSEFQQENISVSANHLASLSTLPSDEWDAPILDL